MTTELSTYKRQYVARKALFSFMGSVFEIHDAAGSLQFYVKQKAFRLKEALEVYKDASGGEKRLTIQARSWGDFSGIYDIRDAQTGETVGAARRHGLRSMFRDEWGLLDADGQERGKIQEQGGALLLLRRFLPIIPQTYTATWGGQEVGTIRQRFDLFRLVYDVDFSRSPGDFDPRLGVGAVILLLAIESQRDHSG